MLTKIQVNNVKKLISRLRRMGAIQHFYVSDAGLPKFCVVGHALHLAGVSIAHLRDGSIVEYSLHDKYGFEEYDRHAIITSNDEPDYLDETDMERGARMADYLLKWLQDRWGKEPRTVSSRQGTE